MRYLAPLVALTLAFGPLSCRKKRDESQDVVAPPQTPDPAAQPTVRSVTAQKDAPTDLLGDPLPEAASTRLGSLRMLDRNLETLAYASAGKEVITSSIHGYVIWEATTGRRLVELSRPDASPVMAVSPGGTRLATGVIGPGTIQLWDVQARAPLLELTHPVEVTGLCFLTDDQLVSASPGQLRIWSLSQNKEIGGATGDFPKMTALGCGKNSIVIGEDSGAVWIHQVGADGQAVRSLGKVDKKVLSATVSPDGKLAAVGSDDGNASLFPTAGGKPKVIQAHDTTVASVVFSPDGKVLWTSGGDQWLRAWTPTSGALAQEMPAQEGLAVQLMALSADGASAAVWSEHRGAKGSEAGRFWLWDVKNGDPVPEPERHVGPLTSIAFSPDGQFIATGSEDNTIRVWQSSSGKLVNVMTGHQGVVNAVEFSGDGSRIWSGGGDGRISSWDYAADQDERPLPPVGGKINTFSFSPDGARLVTGDETGRVWSWDVAARAKVQALDRQAYSSITAVRISADGQYIAITGSERAILVIGANSGAEVARLVPPDAVSNFSVAFSPDSKLLASVGDDGAVRLWDTSTWKQARALEGHDGSVRCVSFSPDGKKLASGGNDTTVRVWDVATGKSLAVLEGHTGAVAGVTFSPDGTVLASASHDQTALLWKTP